MNYSEYACMFILSGFSKSKNNNGYDINVPGSKISKFTKWLCENRGVNGFLCGNEIVHSRFDYNNCNSKTQTYTRYTIIKRVYILMIFDVSGPMKLCDVFLKLQLQGSLFLTLY
ncbi:DEHA2E00682p [Debaryomyces hansenii CBS767]|jgi:hypothetical protein|uniref:DEHA2E00682p n=1 Tax=Debaryomyces hansenii (strain ATCC 36239 / CBS 767 / BCRC 21394 / JCM 1990 / NBRC 0083 / IGC 2968) TaxID=284592 RepID=Q6BR12_DEBHA|nr:DEHA2E00682p [Debaryomyces hansenii CBS767]CAG87548.1 DEHA2E00682p [Debaryomyces hansenii CBS767]|eukprot:XP_459358.1 DEHA2E00682p [Debaryomyces hansenii CBS767]